LDVEGILEGQQRMRIKNLVEGLNAQQRSVPQLPAQARAKHISVLGAKTDPKHPFAGYMVGADESAEPGRKRIGPDRNDPYEQGWRARPGYDFNPYAKDTAEYQKWEDGQAERQAQPNHYDESVDDDDLPDLEDVGEPVSSIMDAERRMAAGDRIFVAHEMDEEPFEIFNVDDLKGYTYDQMLAVPQGVAEAGSPAQQAAIAIAMKKAGKKPESVDEAEAIKQRLDPKCWKGKHIGTPKTKVKGGVRVNNCVPNESVAEAERSELDSPAVQAALAKMAERHKGEKWSKEQLAALGQRIAARGQKTVKEDVTKEDIISKLKAKLGDYLSDISKEIKSDPDLVDKLAAKAPGDQMGPPVKTITTDDGHQIQIHGNEDDGFRISIKNKSAATKFKNLDEAVMACEMYCARRRNQTENADYVNEA
jgi:post-segregation antitoxin (ccd killing protein)